jgi:hypothetical protein
MRKKSAARAANSPSAATERVDMIPCVIDEVPGVHVRCAF